jgi:hypothetical protein
MAEPALAPLIGPEPSPIYANLLRDFAPQFPFGDDQRGLKRRPVVTPALPPPPQGGNWVYPLP